MSEPFVHQHLKDPVHRYLVALDTAQRARTEADSWRRGRTGPKAEKSVAAAAKRYDDARELVRETLAAILAGGL